MPVLAGLEFEQALQDDPVNAMGLVPGDAFPPKGGIVNKSIARPR